VGDDLFCGRQPVKVRSLDMASKDKDDDGSKKKSHALARTYTHDAMEWNPEWDEDEAI
jgi:hypothetical protein